MTQMRTGQTRTPIVAHTDNGAHRQMRTPTIAHSDKCERLYKRTPTKAQTDNEAIIKTKKNMFKYNLVQIVFSTRQNRAMKCHANIKTHNNTIVRPPTDHCHDACPQKVEANLARSLMKQAMKSAVSATPRNVMGSVLSHVSSDVLAHIPKQSSLSRTLLRHRKDGNVPNPGTINFVIPDKYTDFVLHDSGVNDPDRILILGDFELLNELNKDTIYGDGTFDKVPTMFYQLYTWHAKVGNSYPPCLYVLLQKKTWEPITECLTL